jgi:hypothetical protein
MFNGILYEIFFIVNKPLTLSLAGVGSIDHAYFQSLNIPKALKSKKFGKFMYSTKIFRVTFCYFLWMLKKTVL